MTATAAVQAARGSGEKRRRCVAAQSGGRRRQSVRGGPGGERWSPRTSIPLGDVCHLGNIALRSGRRVTWDPAREVVTGDEEQARMVNRPYRALWRMPEIPA